MPLNQVSADILIECPLWGKKRLGLAAFSPDILSAAWVHIKGRSRARPSVSLVFSDDKNVRKLNRKFRGKDKPTNVLSFQSWPDIASLPAGDVTVGDIVVAFETVEREAREKGVSFRDHLAHLLVHGFLHLLGYDHLTHRDADIMEGTEIRILKKMGIKNPYAEL